MDVNCKIFLDESLMISFLAVYDIHKEQWNAFTKDSY